MLTRRQFLQNSAVLAATSLASDLAVAAPHKLKKIGIQLFSVPKLLDKDFAGTLKMLAQMGYKEVELYGPFPFSTPSAQERWNAVTPSLGFKGSGYFGHTAKEVKQILKDNGLTAPSVHTDLDTLKNRMDALGEAGQELGFTYVGLPAIPDELRKNLDAYQRIADDFNKIGEAAKKAGLRFAYHNHGYGLVPMEGKVPVELLLEQTDPNLVFFEMDLYWTTAGGVDPITYLTKYSNRYKLLHIKDMVKKVRFSGDGGDASQWIGLFPFMTDAGSGIIDLKAIMAKAQEIGVEHYIVEQDMVATPETSLKKSFDFLKKL
ncbi:MAG: sugar phosphate isomerase/epimerase [Spirosomataceae bacterium]